MNKILFDDIAESFSDYYDFNTIKEEITNKYCGLWCYNDEITKPFEIVQKFLSIVKRKKSIELFIEYIKTNKPVFMEVIGKNEYILIGFKYGLDAINVIDFEC